uniref:Putative secreted salivary protein n=1 Tax=Ixodes scapularis TaxID=6945 RepID=Q4PMQ4_IXOSC|nr:putative secreted salivary protein [Ixodes scapularis]
MRVLAIVIATLLLLQSLHMVECSQRDRGRRTSNPFPCKQLCDGDHQCGGPCPKCRGTFWTPKECAL